MNMTPCNSSQIASHGFDPVTGTLAIEYKNGGLYHYSGVSAAQYAELCACESVGKFIGAHIKGKHDFKKQPKA